LILLRRIGFIFRLATMRAMLLPVILPIACAWLKRQERRILLHGVPLNATQLADARALGIVEVERIRILLVPTVPLPGGPLFNQFGRLTGMLSETAGLSARYGIYIRAPFHNDRRLLLHELTHTLQYERLGGIRPFLQRYLHECLTIGYAFAPMECEARDTASRF
jgi:hypothetical protein